MEYATAYDVGDHKRGSGINEDSLAIVCVEGGSRDGPCGETRLPETLDGDPPSVEVLDRAPADRVAALLDASATDRITDEGDDASAPPGPHDSAGPDPAGDRPAEPCEDGDGTSPDREIAVFALADGAGGHEAGDVASALAATAVVEGLATVASPLESGGGDAPVPPSEPPTAGEYQGAVADAIQAAHREVLAYADAADTTAFTTVVAGIACDGELHYGWVGDSRIYVVNAVHETIQRLTSDHSVVSDLLDAGEIDDTEALVHPRGHEITRALGGRPGAAPSVEAETHTVPLYAEDVLLFTSDGLVDAQTDAPALHDRYLATRRSEDARERIRDAVVTDAEIRDAVLGADSLDDAGDALLALANDRGGKDNVSAILWRNPDVASTPTPERTPVRAIDPDGPVEDRRTVIVPEE